MVKVINWTRTIFFIITTLVALVATVVWLFYPNKNLYSIGFALIYGAIIGLSITAGYHRLFSHRSYKASTLLKFLYLFFGAGAFQGPVINWASAHRKHHLHTDDLEKDPHSIKKGFWWAHMLWLFYEDKDELPNTNVDDLRQDPLVKFQYDYYVPLASFVSFFIPFLVGLIWGAPWETFFLAGCIRLFLNHQATFCINSLTHMIGERTYSEKHSARDNWFTAFLTFGEGYHNFHHEFPSDYRNGIRFYHWDPTKWLINFFSKLGWAKDLKRTPQEVIDYKKVRLA